MRCAFRSGKRGDLTMMITNKCFFDVLNTIANDKAFDIKYCEGTVGSFRAPNGGILYLHKVLNNYELETLAYCCFILYQDGYINAQISSRPTEIIISDIQGLTFKGYNLLNELSCEI